MVSAFTSKPLYKPIFSWNQFRVIPGKKFDSTKDEGREPLEATVGKIGFKGISLYISLNKNLLL